VYCWHILCARRIDRDGLPSHREMWPRTTGGEASDIDPPR
jgi:hypothetical protein